MKPSATLFLRHSLTMVAAAALLAGCADDAPLATQHSGHSAQLASASSEEGAALATLRRATARYHNLDAAIADGFILLSECEIRPEGASGLLYANLDRVMDGVIDLEMPEGLLYEPNVNGPPKLVAVDLAVPFDLWTAPAPPEFLGTTFQTEDEFGAWAIHVWIWRHNPNGMLAPVNPNVTC
jgi:hypothetical protein